MLQTQNILQRDAAWARDHTAIRGHVTPLDALCVVQCCMDSMKWIKQMLFCCLETLVSRCVKGCDVLQEWGNPVANKSAYDLMLSYSPMDNVKQQPYPSMLAVGGTCKPHASLCLPEYPCESAEWLTRHFTCQYQRSEALGTHS